MSANGERGADSFRVRGVGRDDRRIDARYAALLACLRERGYVQVPIVAHSQGAVVSADPPRYLRLTGRLRAYAGAVPMSMVSVGSPLRDLYAARFPLLYRWLGAPAASFDLAAPAAAELGLARWVNAYRSGDYVGRAVWTPASAASMFSVATVGADGNVIASRAGDRAEFCIGAGAHTHYLQQRCADAGGGDRPADRRPAAREPLTVRAVPGVRDFRAALTRQRHHRPAGGRRRLYMQMGFADEDLCGVACRCAAARARGHAVGSDETARQRPPAAGARRA